jgi:hypothetical protein
MEEIQEQVERLIEDIENDSAITTVEISEALYKLKTEMEDYILRQEEGGSLQWDDLD